MTDRVWKCVYPKIIELCDQPWLQKFLIQAAIVGGHLYKNSRRVKKNSGGLHPSLIFNVFCIFSYYADYAPQKPSKMNKNAKHSKSARSFNF